SAPGPRRSALPRASGQQSQPQSQPPSSPQQLQQLQHSQQLQQSPHPLQSCREQTPSLYSPLHGSW
ncbi:hypothetical protein JTP67_25880, partial [Streptomyces sp. S12]|nr:hypothetical protein [Streptomyces sp. S12]